MKLPIQSYRRLLSRHLRPQWRRVLLLALILACNIGLQLAAPQLIRTFIDSAGAGVAAERLVTLAGLFIVAAFLTEAAGVAATFISEQIGWSATNALRSELAGHCLRLDMSFHKRRKPGELIERIDGDVDTLSNFFSQLIVNVFANLVLMAGVLALLFLEDWRIGLALSIFALIALVTLVRMRAHAVPAFSASMEARAQFYGFLGEHLSGTEDLRANGASGYVLRSFYRRLRDWLPLERKASLSWYVIWMTTLGLFAVGNAVAFGVGAVLLDAGAITLGAVYMIFHYTELLRRPIEQIRAQVQDLQRASASIARVQELFALEPDIRDGQGQPLSDGPLPVAYQQVDFHYEDDQELRLRGISFALAPGRVLGLLGHTGSGKTTLARLLLRLYDPTAGAISLGGQDLRDLSIADLRRRVGSVTQDVQLFHATVRENLTLFDPDIPDARIVDALEELGLRPWLDALPQGLDTQLDGAESLSAGEAQLLAFTRLFLSDPGLIILDEASSRLDPATEQLIERAVARLLRDRTAVIIAHRLDTIQSADEIMILEHGRIAEHGERRALAADPGSRFAGLLRTGMAEVLA